MIGGHDIVVEGRVAAQAPDVVRRYLRASWPEAVAQPAEESTHEVHPLGARSDIWRVPAELLVYRTRDDVARWRDGPDETDETGEETMVHVIFDPDAVTIVVGPGGVGLANDIREALINNGMISIGEAAA